MPPAHGLAQRVRLDPGSRCGRLSSRTGRHHGPRCPSVPARHHDSRNELGDRHWLDHRARPAAHRPLAPRARPLDHPSPRAHRLRGRPHPAAPRALRERRGTAEPRLRAGLRLRHGAGRVALDRGRVSPGRMQGAGRVGRCDADQRPQHRLRGPASGCPGDDEGRRDALRGALMGQSAAATQLRRGLSPPGLDGAPLATLARTRALPGPSLALVPRALGADPARTDLRAYRRHHRGRHDLVAGDTRWRAQLGLSLLMDPRLDLRAVGALQPGLLVGGKRLPLLRGRCGERAAVAERRDRRGRPLRSQGLRGERTEGRQGGRIAEEPGRRAPDHVRHRRARAPRTNARPSARLRRGAPRPRRECRIQAAPARHVGCGARLGLPPHQVARPARRPHLADAGAPGGGCTRALARARPRHLGGPR